MIQYALFAGVVENNKDPDNLGRVQVRVLPELKDVTKEHLPWLRPFIVESNAKQSVHLPKENDIVWCIFMDELFKEGFFIKSQAIDAVVDIKSIEDSLKNISEIGSQSIPKVSYTHYEDGTIHFHNNTTGESGIYHSSGSYTVFDKDGNVFNKTVGTLKVFNTKGSIEILDNGEINIANQGNNLKISASTFEFGGNSDSLVTYNNLKTFLTTWLDSLDMQVHIDPISGVTGISSVPLLPLKTQLQTTDPFKSLKIKTG